MKNKLSSILLFTAVAGILMSSCVAKKKYLDTRANADRLRADSVRMASQLATQNDKLSNLQKSNAGLQQQISVLRNQMDSNSTAASELAQIRRTLENLPALIDQQRKTTNELMTDASTSFSSNGLGVAIKNGKVYVSLQENLVFPPGSAVVDPQGKHALGKLAGVFSINPAINAILKAIPKFLPVSVKKAPAN